MLKDDSQKQDAPHVDGRNLRSQRTASAIAAAFLEMLEQGELRPTVRDVAASAGVSERAVFRHFQDTEALFNEVAKRQITRIIAGIPDLEDADAPLEARLDSLLERWCGVFERATPVRRAANLNEPFSETIQRRRAWARSRRASDFEVLFAQELNAMTAGDRRDARDAFGSLITWYTWESLRTDQGFSVAKAKKIMARTLRAIATGTF